MRKVLGKTIAVLLAGSVAFPAMAKTPAGPKPDKTIKADHLAKLATRLNPDRVIRPRAALSPSWGNIRTFWGAASPMWGNIRTFWGDADPYQSNLTAFWGNIRTFNDGSDPSRITPLWGNIRTFSGDLGASWGNIRTFWGNIRTFEEAPQDYDALVGQIRGMIDLSDGVFGATVLAQTGRSLRQEVVSPLLRKYNVSLTDPASLARLDANAREHFFLEFYDGLMNYSGSDHVDHWMAATRWTPALTQTLGAGADTTIGLLDFTVTGEGTRNIVKFGGVSGEANGHGAAVASLMVAAHDGKGVMGIAPRASVVAYNPFDATGTAGWADIRQGIVMLAQSKASIINMSLGVPGWTLNPDWNGVLRDKDVRKLTRDVVFVMAAGNEGRTQSSHVVWDKDNAPLIVVGSIDPAGNISEFSNRPGNVCLLDGDKCRESMRLMNRFIVAPGEMILVDTGTQVERLSGTSFAAPLVSGTIALIHDRWPWLAKEPQDTVDIILRSARDLGAPGVDPVYGVGALDVQAALSPLDWNRLTYKIVTNGKISSIGINQLRATTGPQRATWEVNGVYMSVFEDTGNAQRDFQIPLSSRLANQTVSVNGSQEQFMGYLTGGFGTWLGAPTAGGNGGDGDDDDDDEGDDDNDLRLIDTGARRMVVPFGTDASATLTMAPRNDRIGYRRDSMPYTTALRIAAADGGYLIQAGRGDGAVAIAGGHGAGANDFDVATGGANPFLGFASGGSYAAAQLRIAPGIDLASGFSQRTLRRELTGLTTDQRTDLTGLERYSASAATLALTMRPVDAISTSLTYTMLDEEAALLGMQSRLSGDLPGGSTTDAATLGANVALPAGLAVSVAATAGRTRAGDRDGALSVGAQGLIATAFRVAIGKDHLFDAHDRVRLTFAQPIHVERGAIDVQSVAVVDRQTGEIGMTTQTGTVSGGARRHVAEMVYGRSMMDDTAQFSLFGRAHVAGMQPGDAAVTIGGSFQMGL